MPTLLRHKHLWHLFKTIQRVGEEAKTGHNEKTLGHFWDNLLPELRKARVFFTSKNEWRTAGEVLFLSEDEADAAAVLEGLGLSLLHADLRPFFNLFRSKEVGVQLVDIAPVSQVLQDAGLDKRVDLARLPTYLRTEKARRQLRRELALLFERPRRQDDQKNAERRLARCAVVPGRDKALWPCQDIYRADDQTIALFASIDPQIPFLANLEEDATALRVLCPEFTPAVAIDFLSRVLNGADTERQPLDFDPAQLLEWFASRREEVLTSESAKHGLVALTMYPCSQGLQPLSTLAPR